MLCFEALYIKFPTGTLFANFGLQINFLFIKPLVLIKCTSPFNSNSSIQIFDIRGL